MWQMWMTGRAPMRAHFFGGGGSDVKKPWTTQSLSSLAGSGRRCSPAEPQLGEFHSGWVGGRLIRRHVRKIREGKQALGKHGFDATVRANANANVLPSGVASALEGTVGSISFSAVTLHKGFGSDCVTILQIYRWRSSTRWITMVVYFTFSSIDDIRYERGA